MNNNIILSLHDHCPNPRCKCQKQITFTLRKFHMEGAGFKKNYEKKSKVVAKFSTFFLKQQLTL